MSRDSISSDPCSQLVVGFRTKSLALIADAVGLEPMTFLSFLISSVLSFITSTYAVAQKNPYVLLTVHSRLQDIVA